MPACLNRNRTLQFFVPFKYYSRLSRFSCEVLRLSGCSNHVLLSCPLNKSLQPCISFDCLCTWSRSNLEMEILTQNLGPPYTRETESPWPLHFKHSHWWKWRSRSKFASHYAWGTNGVRECKMDAKTTWFPTWHRNGSCFMVTWSILKNNFLEVGLTQNH